MLARAFCEDEEDKEPPPGVAGSLLLLLLLLLAFLVCVGVFITEDEPLSLAGNDRSISLEFDK